jgi:hypothetical protein
MTFRSLSQPGEHAASEMGGSGGLSTIGRVVSGLRAWRDRHRISAADRALVEASGCFDAGFYTATYFGRTRPPRRLLDHYLTVGWRRGWSPTADFDAAGYLAVNFDVARAGHEPLLHYLRHGKAEARMRGPTHKAATKALMMRFASLGGNCEFGTVQRFFGAEPVDLFRFAGVPSLPELTRAISLRFAVLRDPDAVGIDYIPWDGVGQLRAERGTEMAAVVPAHGFWFHAGPETRDLNALKRIQTKKLGRLATKLIEEFESGERIFVFLDGGDIRPAIDDLVQAMGDYGPARLLWITSPRSGKPSGTVERLGPRLACGYIETASLAFIRYADWLTVCETAAPLLAGDPA